MSGPAAGMTQTKMAREAGEAPARIADQLGANRQEVRALAERIRSKPPRLLMTCARGSSDHAATYVQYLAQIHLGLPALSLPPSIASVYEADMDLADVLFLVISQSGQSPDLVAGAEWAARKGATVIAMVNVEDSPVAHAAHIVLPLHAGPELSVAATKTFLASLAAGAQVIAESSGESAFVDAVNALPETLERALVQDWAPAVPALRDATSVFVVGRGQGLAGAAEMALKLKETSAMHAESVSSAEIMHGPLGLLQDELPVLVVGQNDRTLPGVEKLVGVLREKGARVFPAYEGAEGADALPAVPGLHPAIAPLAAVQSFYPMASGLSLSRGYDPDQPEHLKKVTETR